jgi:hypothetical protein
MQKLKFFRAEILHQIKKSNLRFLHASLPSNELDILGSSKRHIQVKQIPLEDAALYNH